MECPHCHFDNPPQMKFCGECGTRLEVRCPDCGAEVVAGFKFCGQCGHRLGSPPPVPAAAAPPPSAAPPAPPRREPEPPAAVDREDEGEGEIKQLTVLFCQLVWPTGPPGAERIHTLLGRFFELAQAEIGRYGGTIRQFLGQGFMALFGAPVAYEDHARRGVLAALALARRLAEAGDEGSHPWAARFGLDTGAVIVGGAGGMAVGEATAGAERGEQLAAPGEILLGDHTARLVAGQVALEKVERGGTLLWLARGKSSAFATPVALRQGALYPFIGRRRELAILEELRQKAAAGHGQVVGLAGETGAGKSRLLYEFYRRTFPGQRVSYLRGQCLSYGSAIPYLPLTDMIRKASRLTESDSPATVAAKLEASMAAVGTDPEPTLPFFLRLFGIEEGAEALAELEPLAVQKRTFAALRRMLLDAGQKSLVVVELEDAHWIDDTSEDFLVSLVDVMGAARVLLLVTYRPGFKPRWLEKSYATQMTVDRLSPKESRQLAGTILEHAALPTALAEEVLAQAEGNPLFLEELVHSLADAGPSSETLVPDTIQGILMARIDRLPPAHKRLLKTASVLGREFSPELLAALWQGPQPMAPLLADLRGWEFLYQAPSEETSVHFFKHALTQEVAYESLLTDRRQKLHRLAARRLEELYAGRPEDAYDQLIYHYPRAGEPAKTVHYLRLFAARAARGNAHAEAAKALGQALEQAELLAAEETDRRVIEVLLELAESLLPLARFPETLELCRRHGERLARLDDPSLTARYYFWLAHTHTYLGDQEETRRCAELAITAARDCGDETTEGKACYVLGRDGFWSGRFAEGVASSLRAVVLLERSSEPWWQGQAYWVAGFNHYVSGHFDQAIEALERACTIGEALDDYRLDASWSLGYFYASLGQWQAGIDSCQRGLERSQDPLNTAVAMGFLGYAQLAKGDVAAAIPTLRESVERLRGTGMQQILGWFSVFLGEAHLAASELREAREVASQGLEVTVEAEFRYGVGLAHQTLGRIALAAGESEVATVELGEALAIFEDLEVPFEVGRTRLDRARLARGEAGASELAAARDIFERLGVPFGVEQTDRLAAEWETSGESGNAGNSASV